MTIREFHYGNFESVEYLKTDVVRFYGDDRISIKPDTKATPINILTVEPKRNEKKEFQQIRNSHFERWLKQNNLD